MNNKKISSSIFLLFIIYSSHFSRENDIARILIATDNHVGFMERDPIRGYDSFAAFEEILATARRENVDCVFLAGDLFHENKPSRYTLWR